MLEAQCRKCKESFVPEDENDLIHGMRDGGSTPCGGRGQLTREYFPTRVQIGDAQAVDPV